MHRLPSLTTLLCLPLALVVACGGSGDNQPGPDAQAESMAEAGEEATAEVAKEGLSDPDAQPDSTAEPEPDTMTDTAAEAETVADPEPDMVPDTEPEADADQDAADEAEAEVTAPAIQWGPCPDYIAYDSGFQCAFVPLPLDPAQPEGASIEVFVYRLRATQAEGKRQVWFLQGGPGGSGADFAQLFMVYSMVHPEWEMYSLDHRGVGNSARLTCPQEQDLQDFDFAGCAQALKSTWGEDGLAQFSTTNAALDLGAVVDLARQPGVPVFVYGASYGTYWGLRYLQLFPEQADGVILDSICSPGACHLDEYDRNFNDNGKLIMQACAQDATCAAKLGAIAPTPWEAMAAMYQKIDDGTLCDGGYSTFLDRPTARMVFGFLEMDSMTRVLIPALVYRAFRCDPGDRAVLELFFQQISQGLGYSALAPQFVGQDQLDGSMTLGTNIIVAELLGSMSYEEVQAIADAAFFSVDASPSMLKAAEQQVWPVYPDDGYMNRWGETATPMLMLNGTLDPQTTLAMAQPSGDHYQGANQSFLAMELSPHGVIFSSQTWESIEGTLMGDLQGTIAAYTRPCGFQVMEGFVTDPTAPLDTSCLSDLYPLEFGTESTLNRLISLYLLGTEDLYEGGLQRVPVTERYPFRYNPFAKPVHLHGR
jgi:pimeloyl-ACP methyl ester carboxylesterase